MCFLVLQHRVRADHPVVLLHNRDEAYDRPFVPPRLLDVKRGVVAPRDLEAGGSWIGMNRAGLVVAISNRRGESASGGTRSRGLVVLDALRQPSAQAALLWVRAHLERIAYAGFNLLLADAMQAFVVRHRGAPEPGPLPGQDTFELFPGVYVLTHVHEPGTVPPPAAARPREGETIDEAIARLEALAGDTSVRLPGDEPTLRRGERRGTVASAVVVPPRFRFASGPPDRTPFEDVHLA